MKNNSGISGVDIAEPFAIRVMKKAQIVTKKQNFLHQLAVILVSICTLGIAWIIQNNKNKSVSFKEVINSFNFNYLYIILSIIVVGLLLKTFMDFLFLYTKTRQRRFLVMLKGNITNKYYNDVMSGSCGYYVYSSILSRSGVEEKLSCDAVFGKKIIDKISMLIYSFIVLVIGCIFVFSSTSWWLFAIAIICFIINVMFVLFVLYFDKTKYSYIKFIGAMSKCLYDMRLIRNYEKFYTQTIDKLVIYNTVLKSGKKLIVTQIFSGIIGILLRHTMIFLFLVALNHGTIAGFASILFNATIMDLIIGMWPIKSGLLIFEILFISLFRNVFFEGYVLWGMILYRLLDYILNIVLYFISTLFKVKERRNEVKEILEEREEDMSV